MGARILWAVVGGFLAGIFLRSFLPLGLSFVGLLILLATATLFLSLIVQKNVRGVIVVAALLSLAGGVLRMGAAALVPDPVLTAQLGEEATLEGFVFDEPDVREASVRIPVRLSSGAGVLVVAPAHTSARYGDRVRAEGALRTLEAFETGVGREFNYPAYLAKDGIGYELSFAHIEVVGRAGTNPIKSLAISIKQKFLEGLGLALPEPHAGLAGGITVGDKRGLGEELGDVFRIVGLTHIVVLSGYNIMIVMEGLSRLLLWFSASRYLRLALTIFVALLFVFMTGLASASVRAALMAVIAVAGRMSGRMYLAGRALGLVALAMVMWNPFILAFDPGFQLSVLATAGLIIFSPIFAGWMPWIPEKFALRESAATTLAAQLAVLPLLLYQTWQLSLFSLPANLLALVAVPWAMLLSAIAALGGILFGSLGVIIAFPAYALLAYIIEIGSLFASLPYASIALPAFSAWWLIPIYIFLFASVLAERKIRDSQSSNVS